MTAPPGPEGVRIIRGDQEISVELVYAGIDEDGVHMWLVIDAFNPRTDRLHIDLLPPHTALQLSGWVAPTEENP